MTQVGRRTAIIPMGIGGQASAYRDPSKIPDGNTLLLKNYQIRPGGFPRRPPFVYDGLMNVVSMLRWEDLTNQVTDTLAIDASQNLRTKNTNGIGYTATVKTGTPSGRLTDFTNFMGKVYQVFDNGSGVPSAASVYDGNAVSSAPFNSTIFSRTITAFKDRLFLMYPRVTITNALVALSHAYDWTNNTAWPKTAVTASIIQSPSGSTVCRLFPTSTGASACSTHFTTIGSGVVWTADSVTAQQYLLRHDILPVDAQNAVPMTYEVFICQGGGFIPGAKTFVLGDLVVRSGFIQKCTTGGAVVDASAEPAWSATVGATTAWGAATFTNIGSQVIASLEFFVPPASTSNNVPYTAFLPITVPAGSGAGLQLGLGVTLKFYNSLQTALTALSPIDISVKDGKADGDPAKQNYGFQITKGDFYFPFFNQEGSLTATQNLDSIVWSEILKPEKILAKNTFSLSEIAGLPTAAAVVAGRLLGFKRRGFWVFRITTDKNSPILPEIPANTEFGCIGPRALDTFENVLYWIGENGIYRMTDDWSPQEICGPQMREEIMSRGAGWVESQSTYNMPFLVADHFTREIFVYTQKGKIYVYHVETSEWSTVDVSGSPEVRSMFYDYAGNRMCISFGGSGATLLLETSTAQDTIDNTATNLPITDAIVFKPLEMSAPRYEAALESVGLFHVATASQTGNKITASFSLDRGATFTTPTDPVSGGALYPVQADLTSPRVPLPIGTVAPSVTVKVSATGNGGQASWCISVADATLQVKRGELPWANAVTVGA